jgi:hypothetical protein
MKPRTYVASRASIPERPRMWKDFRENGAEITSSWIDESGLNETPSFSRLWARIVHEVGRSEQLLLYVEQTDFPLKGAFVECGIALGLGLPVFVVTDFSLGATGVGEKMLGSWIWHPQVSIYTHSGWGPRAEFMASTVFRMWGVPR